MGGVARADSPLSQLRQNYVASHQTPRGIVASQRNQSCQPLPPPPDFAAHWEGPLTLLSLQPHECKGLTAGFTARMDLGAQR